MHLAVISNTQYKEDEGRTFTQDKTAGLDGKDKYSAKDISY